MLSGKYAGSGATKLRTIKAAGGRRGWRKLRGEALRVAGEGIRQVLRSAKAGEVFFPRESVVWWSDRPHSPSEAVP